jgi:hypothetical protein
LGVTAGYIGILEAPSTDRHATLDFLIAAAKVNDTEFELKWTTDVKKSGLPKE